jgi:hypothetical protein
MAVYPILSMFKNFANIMEIWEWISLNPSARIKNDVPFRHYYWRSVHKIFYLIINIIFSRWQRFDRKTQSLY